MTHRITGDLYSSRRSVVMARRGMVATSHPLAAQAGLRVLLAGGNAVDAAVATAATLGVVEPMSTGLGGDAFALIYWAKDGKVKALNASGRAPLAANLDDFRGRGLTEMPTTGMLPVTVPGSVDGYDAILQAYGTLSLAQVLEPAIEYASDGFPVTEIVSCYWHMAEQKLAATPDAARTYLPNGRPPRPGEIFRTPNLARTLRLIADQGRDAFYRGEIAEKIVKFSKANGGLLTREDFEQHHSDWVEPLWTDYRGHRVYECPPNGQGLAALIAMNIVEGYDLAAWGHNSDALHVLIEAMRIGMTDAAEYVADPEFADIPVEFLLSKEYARTRREALDMRRAVAEVRPGMPAASDTVYLTTADQWGNAVSFINSLYMGFGSGLVAGDTGVTLQNRGALFSLDPQHRNCLEPGKRPYHTIIPAMVTKDGKLCMSYGVMGGFMQPQGHLQVLCNIVDFGMNVQEALDAPRFMVTQGKQVALEARSKPEVRDDLVARGHAVVVQEGWVAGFGGGQVIAVDPVSGVWLGASEPRQDGCAVGF